MAPADYPHSSSPAVSAAMRGNRRADTKPEMLLRSLLHVQGYRFRKDLRLRVGSKNVRPDITFAKQKVAVFVDGCFWHLCPDHGRVPGGKNAEYWRAKLHGNAIRDRSDTEALQESGWTVVRVWEHEPVDSAVERIVGRLS